MLKSDCPVDLLFCPFAWNLWRRCSAGQISLWIPPTWTLRCSWPLWSILWECEAKTKRNENRLVIRVGCVLCCFSGAPQSIRRLTAKARKLKILMKESKEESHFVQACSVKRYFEEDLRRIKTEKFSKHGIRSTGDWSVGMTMSSLLRWAPSSQAQKDAYKVWKMRKKTSRRVEEEKKTHEIHDPGRKQINILVFKSKIISVRDESRPFQFRLLSFS